MLSSAIKSNAFIPYKESCFYKMTNLEMRKVLYFCLRLLPRKCVLRKCAGNISRFVGDQVKFYRWFFSFGIPLQKSSSLFPSCTVKCITPECHNFNFWYLHVESEPGLIFKVISSLANLNLRTKVQSFSIANSYEKGFKKNYI